MSTLSRRQFLILGGAAAMGAGSYAYANRPLDREWQRLLPYYYASTQGNIVTVNGRRALLSARIYPGTYVRDAVFWGPLGLNDPQLGYECYQWFAESPLENGQIRSAVPLTPEEVDRLEPQDDEGSLLFILCADWLRGHGFELDTAVIENAYRWVQTHVKDDLYISPPGPFRYWADTVAPDVDEAIAHNQGLLALARRAMVNMRLGGVMEQEVAAAQAGYRSFYDHRRKYIALGKQSVFAEAQDTSAVFPEFLSRYLYNEPILSDKMARYHAERLSRNGMVDDYFGELAGIKVISGPDGEFLPPSWYHAPSINTPGEYQNGGYWPLYGVTTLALGYALSGKRRFGEMIGKLVTYELETDHRSKEIIRMAPGQVGVFDEGRTNYTWNGLIPAICKWAGL